MIDPGETSGAPLPQATPWHAALQRIAYASTATAHGVVGSLSKGSGDALVLLHGIGSGAASWVAQIEALSEHYRVIAWDAPGYGSSPPLPDSEPTASQYAQALGALLDAHNVARCTLVGHSLGAIVAAAFAAVHAERVTGLLLLSPAQGYGREPALGEIKLRERLELLQRLGPAGLAAQRAAAMLSSTASASAREWVRWNMARVLPTGYAQASHLLAYADLRGDLQYYRGKHLEIAVGSADTITPAANCASLAQRVGCEFQLLEGLGHACYVEAPERLNAVIAAFTGRVSHKT